MTIPPKGNHERAGNWGCHPQKKPTRGKKTRVQGKTEHRVGAAHTFTPSEKTQSSGKKKNLRTNRNEKKTATKKEVGREGGKSWAE